MSDQTQPHGGTPLTSVHAVLQAPWAQPAESNVCPRSAWASPRLSAAMGAQPWELLRDVSTAGGLVALGWSLVLTAGLSACGSALISGSFHVLFDQILLLEVSC